MSVILSTLGYMLGGIAVGLILMLMRLCVDRHRDLPVEVGGVTAPILMVAIISLATGNPFDGLKLGHEVAPIVEFVFLAFPIFVIARLVEKSRSRESVQLSDLFRLTTAAALALFVFRALPDPLTLLDVMLVCSVYLAGEAAAISTRPLRNLALAVNAFFICSLVFILIFNHSVLEIISLPEWLSSSRWFRMEMSGIFAPYAFIAAIACTPACKAWSYRYFKWLHRLAHRVAIWRCATVDPQALIRLRPLLAQWQFRTGVCYLNHGSFGAVPLLLRDVQTKLRRQCEDEPMDTLARKSENAWLAARFELATWLGTLAENVALVENATAGMNEVAGWFPLQPDDEVLINDHEYGAVRRIWQRACQRSNATLVNVILPLPLTSPSQIVDAILNSLTKRTKLVIMSHITSPTAIILPVEELCSKLRERGIASCVDGPHAPLQQPLKLSRLDCDFYVASCHKWLCAPLGSGFVYVSPRWQSHVQPLRLSWGRLHPNRPESWTEELLWTGSRDYSAMLTIPHAISFFQKFDIAKLDERNHALAAYARRRLSGLFGAEPVTPEGREWFGWMVAVWLPPGSYSDLQSRLWSRYKIEVPIVQFGDRTLVRVSCHLYNSTQDIDLLFRALEVELKSR